MTEKKKQDDKPHSVHDLGYKFLFSFWQIFQQLMDGYVDGDWKKRLDYSRCEKLNKTFIMRGFRKRESDILYKVPLVGEEKEVYLYVLIEHQSTVDYTIAFRVLVYLVEIWKDFYNNSDKKWRKQKNFRLPPVFPIVLYNGKNSWTAAYSVKDLVEQGEIFKDFVPNVKYHLVDIPRIPKDKLEAMGDTLSAVFSLDRELSLDEFIGVLQRVVEILYKGTDEELWKVVSEWIVMRMKREFSQDELQYILKDIDISNNKQEVKTMLETMPKKFVAFGKQEGVQESIIKVAKARFKNVPKELIENIQKINSPEILDEILESVATTSSLEDVKKMLSKLTTVS